jgi:hypothetical protein
MIEFETYSWFTVQPVRVLRGFAGIFLLGVPKLAKPRWVMDRHPALPRDTRILRQRPPLNLVVLVGPTEHNPVPVVKAPANALKPLPQLPCVDLVTCSALWFRRP